MHSQHQQLLRPCAHWKRNEPSSRECHHGNERRPPPDRRVELYRPIPPSLGTVHQQCDRCRHQPLCRTGTVRLTSGLTYIKCVQDRYQHLYGMGGLTRSTRTSIFSNIQHFAVYVSTFGSCMPSRRLRRLDAPLVIIICSIHPPQMLMLIRSTYMYNKVRCQDQGIYGFIVTQGPAWAVYPSAARALLKARGLLRRVAPIVRGS